MQAPTIAWSHLLSSAHGPRRKHDIKLTIKTGEAKGFSIELHGAETHKVCSCKKCALWMFAAYTCPCCGARERQLFGNAQTPEKSQKKFQEKYGLLKAVEAGEDVRNIGRIELAFQNGDVLSVGVQCHEKNDGEYFRSIIEAFRGTAGLIMCKESRCKARRCKGKMDGEQGNLASLGSGDEAADAERHMQELLAMEVESAKRGLAGVSTSSRRAQRRQKLASNPAKIKFKDLEVSPPDVHPENSKKSDSRDASVDGASREVPSRLQEEIVEVQEEEQTDSRAPVSEQSFSTESNSACSPDGDISKESNAAECLDEEDAERSMPGWMMVRKSNSKRSTLAVARTRPDEACGKAISPSSASTCASVEDVVLTSWRPHIAHESSSSQSNMADEVLLPCETLLPSAELLQRQHCPIGSLHSGELLQKQHSPIGTLPSAELLQKQHSPIGTPLQTQLPHSIGPPPSYPAPPPPPPPPPFSRHAVANEFDSEIPLGALLPSVSSHSVQHSSFTPWSGERADTWNPWQNKLFFCRDDSPYAVSPRETCSIGSEGYLHGHVRDVALGPLLCK